jgi:predicted DNA binding CopG/RHH family protein
MTGNWFRQAREFESELSSTNSIFETYRGINCDVDFKMEIDTEDDETNAQRFRDYAAECRRLARTASETDRVVLIEIAEAWIVCAEQAERNAKRYRER